MEFLCDAMLGGLARWLRAAGYDTYYAREGTNIDDRALTERALREGRVMLTGDRGFLERAPVRDGRLELLLLPHLPVEEQLRVVIERFELEPRPSRCMECNGELETVPPEAVAGRVPPGVARERREFWRCRSCGRVFWHGSHWARISRRLERVFS
ncbi:hypothetical protein GBA65_18735 [Rubrobacter marinus]|uniref:Mut7-C RNAse domain-containing protein n=1 Tax=Rubrobacter marinus TaxID=2653852 RepID=A0A6G8Q179_9ACTN|nr:Mut7-C RNAse domain-containing protein [Rubrobacter marinus]QIN80221.1 hypothetical protein GBA65_18735 [Rubrobacter marinus]